MEKKLFMLLLGCKPEGRHTEQHDVFFGIGSSLSGLIPQIEQFWPDGGKIHLDGWREVLHVDGYRIRVSAGQRPGNRAKALFFLNLGGYKPGEMEEFHYKFLTVAADKPAAVAAAKATAFYKHTGFGKDAVSHIDDRYGVDVDDIYDIEDILPKHSDFHLEIFPDSSAEEDQLHLGYIPLDSLVPEGHITPEVTR